jgi:hypothetical protein
MRRDVLTHKDYEKKYAGLEHTYFKRDSFRSRAAERGLNCDVFDGCVPDYVPNKFRFGTLLPEQLFSRFDRHIKPQFTGIPVDGDIQLD